MIYKDSIISEKLVKSDCKENSITKALLKVLFFVSFKYFS